MDVKAILENIDIDKEILGNVNINKGILDNFTIDSEINFLKQIFMMKYQY